MVTQDGNSKPCRATGDPAVDLLFRPQTAGPSPRALRTVLLWNHEDSLYSLRDRKSTRLNSSHVSISYAVFCLKKKNEECEQHAVGVDATAGDAAPRPFA